MDVLVGLVGMWALLTVLGSGLVYMAHLEDRCMFPDEHTEQSDTGGGQ